MFAIVIPTHLNFIYYVLYTISWNPVLNLSILIYTFLEKIFKTLKYIAWSPYNIV
jgi:hypothetical protein